MLVGQTYSGKSSVMNNLRMSLTSLDGIDAFRRVKIILLNPKSVTGFQLYGKLDQDTKLWTDGILPNLMIEIENDVKNVERKWMVFDGPVDAVWIENMNTVLDDNKVLCLTNGQKIKVTPQTNLMFEVEDLFYASPATVSRCGMVFLEPIQLGWKPLVRGYIEFHMPPYMLECSDYMIMNCEWLLEAVLVYAQTKCKFPWTQKELNNAKQAVCDLVNKHVKM